jgi:hypothetical protein
MANYNFFYPTAQDSMSDVEKNITDNLKIIESRNDIPVFAAGADLPQSGNYEIGDRVFRNDIAGGNTWPSNYLLICKDANWGWHWRPIQQIISPWVSVPTTAIQDANFTIDPLYPLQIALDSRGFCHWRGAIKRTTPGIPAATSFNVFKEIPLGIRPNVKFMHTCALSPFTGSAVGKAGNISGRIYMQEDGVSSVRCWNSNNGVSQYIWFDGMNYNNSYHWYFGG